MPSLARVLLIITFIIVSGSTFAVGTEKVIVAVIPFQNQSHELIKWDARELAKRLGNHLKRTGRFETVNAKEVERAIKNAAWDGERLGPEIESKLSETGAQYAVYGGVMDWRMEPVTGGVTVSFSITLVDLVHGKSNEPVFVTGVAVGPVELDIDPDERAIEDEAKNRPLYQDASDTALRKAAERLRVAVKAPD